MYPRQATICRLAMGLWLLLALLTEASLAQQPITRSLPPPVPIDPASGWTPGPGNVPTPQFDTSVLPSGAQLAPLVAPAKPGVTLIALLKIGGQAIDQGIIWRVYSEATNDGKPELLQTLYQPNPSLELAPGSYLINAAFGRSYLTRKIVITTGIAATETFVLNAGGLRMSATRADGRNIPADTVTYDVFSDERNQFGERTQIMAGVKQGIVLRLNAGIYHIVSKFGDANAIVTSDVIVEAGKLTQVAITHAAANITLRLVKRSGGEALAGTFWSLATDKGVIVKESSGAIPSHIVAAGNYVVSASFAGVTYRSAFSVNAGQNALVEVVMQ